MDIKKLCWTLKNITWVSKNTSGMFHSDYLEAHVIIPCPKKIICNSYDKNLASGDKLDDGVKFY